MMAWPLRVVEGQFDSESIETVVELDELLDE
jgi:hypothetical protein